MADLNKDTIKKGKVEIQRRGDRYVTCGVVIARNGRRYSQECRSIVEAQAWIDNAVKTQHLF